ncbi:MAG: PQQ-binding-like beta-propeller repeat protein, partial [Verrucomicrobiota bacterium]
MRSFQLACVAAVAFNVATRAADWPSWRGPDRNGISQEIDWSSDWGSAGPAKLWTASVGVGFSAVAVSADRVFTAGWADGQDTVRCLDAATGKVLWAHSYEEKLGNKMYEGGPNATPVVAGTQVFAVSKTGRTLCLDAASGKVRWGVDLAKQIGAKLSDWGVSGSPVLADSNTVLIAYGPAGVALDAGTGRALWNSGNGKDMTFATPVVTKIGGHSTALFFMSEKLVAIDPKDGRPKWTSAFGQGYRTHCSDPVVTGDRVFISSGDDGGELLEVSGGSAMRVWKNRNLSTFTGTAVLLDGMLYGHETAGYKRADQELRCVDLETGSVKWGEKGFGQGSIIAAGDRLIVLSDQGELSVVRANPANFELLARFRVIG